MIRFCEPAQEVLTSGPIANPHVLVIFHKALLKKKSTIAGLLKDGVLIVNTGNTPDDIADMLGISGIDIYCVDAMKISLEEKVKINTVLLGVVSAAIGFIDPESIKEVIAAKLERKYAHLIEGNLKAFDRGGREFMKKSIPFDPARPVPETVRAIPKLGYTNAPIGGVIQAPGNTALKDLSLTRTGYVPILDMAKCIHCGECDMTCPDYCFSWEKRTDEKGRERMYLKGIDYRYCKGCLKCVEICSPGALTKAVESMVEVIGVPQFDLME